MRRIRAVITVLLIVGVAVASLTGCALKSDSGSDTATPMTSCPSAAPSTVPSDSVADLPVDDLLARSLAVLCYASGVHVTGANDSAKTPFALDMSYSQDGSTGTFSAGGYDVQLREIDAIVYIKGPDQFWKQRLSKQPLALAQVSGKWVAGPTDDAITRDFAAVTDLHTFAGSLFGSTGGVVKGGTSTVEGTEVIALSGKDGTLFVSTADARPVLLTGSGDTEGSRLVFSDYGTVPVLTVPPADETVHTSDLRR